MSDFPLRLLVLWGQWYFLHLVSCMTNVELSIYWALNIYWKDDSAKKKKKWHSLKLYFYLINIVSFSHIPFQVSKIIMALTSSVIMWHSQITPMDSHCFIWLKCIFWLLRYLYYFSLCSWLSGSTMSVGPCVFSSQCTDNLESTAEGSVC